MKYALLLLVFAVPQIALAQASAVYITRDGAGTQDGSSLANAGACDATAGRPQTTCAFFNNSSNWGTGAKQIGPGTIVHLGGDGVTITAAQSVSTAYLQFQRSGASGNVIELLFDANVALTSPQFNAAIDFKNNSYILLDGGHACGTTGVATPLGMPQNACSLALSGTGTIENTQNGTGLWYQNASGMVSTRHRKQSRSKKPAVVEYLRSHGGFVR